MEESERAWGPIRAERRAYKPHLLFRWAAELVRESAVLDAVEDIIGPNILVYQFTIFPKESRDPGFVDWHQDATYFSLKPDAQIAASRAQKLPMPVGNFAPWMTAKAIAKMP